MPLLQHLEMKGGPCLYLFYTFNAHQFTFKNEKNKPGVGVHVFSPRTQGAREDNL